MATVKVVVVDCLKCCVENVTFQGEDFVCNNCGFRNFVDGDKVTGAAGPDMAYIWCAAWSEAFDLGSKANMRRMLFKWNTMPRLVRAVTGLVDWHWWHHIKD